MRKRNLPLTWDTNPRQRLNASGGSQPRNDEGASHFARRGKNAEAFLICTSIVLPILKEIQHICQLAFFIDHAGFLSHLS